MHGVSTVRHEVPDAGTPSPRHSRPPGLLAGGGCRAPHLPHLARVARSVVHAPHDSRHGRSEEHTSELQSLAYLVCRLLLEKKKNTSANEELQSINEELE